MKKIPGGFSASGATFLRASIAAASASASSVLPLAWKSVAMLPLARIRLLICRVSHRHAELARVDVKSLPADDANAIPGTASRKRVSL